MISTLKKGDKIKAAVFYKPHDIRIEEKGLREIKDTEVLLKVKACGVCGTDIHIYEGTANSKPPVILGHEYVGIVEEAGKAVSNFGSGNRVVIDPNIVCGFCHFCQLGKPHFCENLTALGVHIDGGFAEYSIVPQTQLYHLPLNIPFDIGCLAEPVSCAIHGIDLAGIRVGDCVVIIGAGAIGLVMTQLVRLCGARKVIVAEPTEERRDIALKLNADIVVDPTDEDLKEIVLENSNLGADVIIECAGIPETARASIELTKRGGKIIFFGVCDKDATVAIRPQEIYLKELTIRGSYINPNTFSRAIDLLSEDRLTFSDFDIGKFTLTGLIKAFQSHKERKHLKNIVIPNP